MSLKEFREWKSGEPDHNLPPTTAMTHIAMQEKKDGRVVEWMEKVTGEQYRK